MAGVIVDGQYVEYSEWRARELEREAQEFKEKRQLQREALELLQGITEAYNAYKEFVRAHPKLAIALPEEQTGNQQFYDELRQNLERADQMPRCMHVKADGLPCGAPRMKTGDLCFAHQRMANAQALKLRLTSYEDANGIQIALMEVAKALVDGKITPKVGGLLFYSLQTAARNVPRVTFSQTPAEKVVREETQVRAAGQEVKVDESRLTYEGYRYETMDPDLRKRLMELGAEIDRRDLEKKKAAEGKVPESFSAAMVATESNGVADMQEHAQG